LEGPPFRPFPLWVPLSASICLVPLTIFIPLFIRRIPADIMPTRNNFHSPIIHAEAVPDVEKPNHAVHPPIMSDIGKRLDACVLQIARKS
jgi:hypothetical protein